MINKVTLIGNLGADPEVRRLEGGVTVARFSLATHENYQDKEGNWQTLTEWHNVVAWRGLAERIERSLRKGMLVYVEGKISYRKYTGQDGLERYVTDIVANNIRILERRESADSRFPSLESAPPSVQVPPPTSAEIPQGGDDLPF
ncbi:MAG: single-stranded DNA-binding protein [Saprospiraceae bacterium]|nr:single-stranded DNA-binding protein [Saprospiraceae bacterium]MDW8483726.1 single-stranded DNA-binding protein [Saprospiraceae bacterium]